MTALMTLKTHLKAVDHISEEEVEFKKLIKNEEKLLAAEIQLIKNLILGYTGGTGNIFSLSGSKNVNKRQQINSILMDKKMSTSSSGVNVIRKQLIELSGLVGLCNADLDYKLTQWIKGE